MDIWDASQGASCATVGDTDGAAVGFSVQMPQRMGQMVCQRGLSDASLHMCAVFGLHRTGSSCLPKQSVGLDVGLLLGPAVGLAVGKAEGANEGDDVGADVGLDVGDAVGQPPQVTTHASRAPTIG